MKQGSIHFLGGSPLLCFPKAIITYKDCPLIPTRESSAYSCDYCIYISIFLSALELIGAYSLGPLAYLWGGGVGLVGFSANCCWKSFSQIAAKVCT